MSMMAQIEKNQDRMQDLERALDRLCNEAAVLVYHCGGFKDGGLGAFATAREFTKCEIAQARKLLGR